MTALATFPQPVRFLPMPDLTKTRIDLPDDERGRAPDTIKRFDRLQRKLANPKLTAKERDAVLAELAQIENAPSRRSDEAWSRTATTESVALAGLRGEQVATEGGAWRVMDRDPLLSLLRAGALTLKQFDAGKAVCELYDLRKADTSSVAFDGMPAAAHDHERFIATRFLRAKASVPAGQLEVAVLNGHYRSRTGSLFVLKCWPGLRAAGMEPHISLRVLRDVCCEGRTLTSLGRGRAYDRHRKALAWALDVADEVLDAPRNGMVKP